MCKQAAPVPPCLAADDRDHDLRLRQMGNGRRQGRLLLQDELRARCRGSSIANLFLSACYVWPEWIVFCSLLAGPLREAVGKHDPKDRADIRQDIEPGSCEF